MTACTQCKSRILQQDVMQSRHAAPCSHVICGTCVARIESDQMSGRYLCRTAGCGEEVAPVRDFTTAWCTQRPARIALHLATLMSDQGDAGDKVAPDVSPRAMPGRPSWGMCSEHKEVLQGRSSNSKRLVCASCIRASKTSRKFESLGEAVAALELSSAADAVQAGKFKEALAEVRPKPEDFFSSVARWQAEETARIKEWEGLEVARVQSFAEECLGLVVRVAERRRDVGAAVLGQRLTLWATLDELEYELDNLSSDPAARLAQLATFATDRRRIVEQLRDGFVTFPTAASVGRWAELPSLMHDIGDAKSPTARQSVEVVVESLKSALSRYELLTPDTPLPNRLPVMPQLVRCARGSTLQGDFVQSHLGVIDLRIVLTLSFPSLTRQSSGSKVRSLDLGGTPSVFAELDHDRVVIGWSTAGPAQVWDLRSERMVREFEGAFDSCTALLLLPDGRVVVGGVKGGRPQAVVFDQSTGKILQSMAWTGGSPQSMCFVRGHLLMGVQVYRIVHVWSMDPVSGQFSEKTPFYTAAAPHGPMVALSSRTVALACTAPTQVEIWDWGVRARLSALRMPFEYALGLAALPRGRVVSGSENGVIKYGDVDDWASASTIENRHTVVGIAASQDGSFATADFGGDVKVWRDGKCVASFPGVNPSGFYGIPIAIAGRRLLAVGTKARLLVME